YAYSVQSETWPPSQSGHIGILNPFGIMNTGICQCPGFLLQVLVFLYKSRKTTMERIIKTPLILTIFLLLLASCSEEWLKPDPLSFLAPENVYVNEAGFEAILVTLRKDLQYESTGNRHP